MATQRKQRPGQQAGQRLAQAVLQALAGGCSGIPALMEATGLAAFQVSNAAQTLRRRGFVEIQGPGAYRVTDAGHSWLLGGRCVASGQGGRVHKRARGLRARAWWLMRELRKFTLGDLLTTLAEGAERDARGNLGRYLAALEEAGVVTRMRRRVPCAHGHGGEVIWYLRQDLGRIAPVARAAAREVFDPNAGALVRPADEATAVEIHAAEPTFDQSMTLEAAHV